MKHEHYHKNVRHLDSIDVYRVLELFEVTCPVMQHIAKKALCAGNRGHKDLRRDIQDIIDSALRKLEMMREDEQGTGSSDEEGWIPWDGSNPYGPGGLPESTVEVKFRNKDRGAGRAGACLWKHNNQPYDIIAYRIIK